MRTCSGVTRDNWNKIAKVRGQEWPSGHSCPCALHKETLLRVSPKTSGKKVHLPWPYVHGLVLCGSGQNLSMLVSWYRMGDISLVGILAALTGKLVTPQEVIRPIYLYETSFSSCVHNSVHMKPSYERATHDQEKNSGLRTCLRMLKQGSHLK